MTAPLDPATTALLVMDYQAGIVGRIPDADALVARTAEVLAAARAAGCTIGYVRVAFTEADMAAVPDHHSFAAYKGNPEANARLADDAAATQVVDALAPQDGDVVVRKVRVGPFTTTDLQARLESRGVTTLVLAGISTSGVVLSTVRQAVDLDFRVVVLEDGCADTDDEVHRVLMTKLYPKQGDVISCAEVLALLG